MTKDIPAKGGSSKPIGGAKGTGGAGNSDESRVGSGLPSGGGKGSSK